MKILEISFPCAYFDELKKKQNFRERLEICVEKFPKIWFDLNFHDHWVTLETLQSLSHSQNANNANSVIR